MASSNPFTSVKVFYFALPAIGRGEVVRLLLEDAGIPFEDDRVEMDAWKTSVKTEVVRDGRNPASHVPIVTIDGRVYTEHISIGRYIDRRRGVYGKDVERDYFADAIADAYQEWRNSWVKSLGSSAEDKATHLKDNSARFATVFETFRGHYAKDGPFFTGSQFTFADAAVFQVIHDEIKTNGFVLDEAHYPRLKAFYAAVQARPNIAAYLASPRRHE